jgi:pathogenesis-related protein 1
MRCRLSWVKISAGRGSLLFALVLACAPSSSSTAVATPAREQGAASSAFVEAHNRLRRKHCAPPLRWSAKVAASAQRWADHLRGRGCRVLEHSRGAYGENLAAGTSGMLTPERVVEMWYAEKKDYPWRRGGFSMSTGHFTQVVWKETSDLGCAQAQCAGLDVWVCQYDRPGNVEGEYARNVAPEGCK